MSTPRLVVAGTHSGVGKTTVATGLMAALAARAQRVAGFKVGPDFIDPSYHQLATGRPGRNLDAYLCGPERIAALFAHGAGGADIAVVEGVMGLFDGASGHGELASTAHISKLLDAPVLLVVDAAAMARSVAALVHGYATFDPDLRIAGVIANRVGSGRHAALIADALAPLGIPLLGVLARDGALRTPSRHLGLVPVAERTAEATRAVTDLGARLGNAVDLDALQMLARSASALTVEAWSPPPAGRARARVAVAGGPAFSFAYTENLELLTAAGAELAAVDPTRDEALPAGTDALYLGGGFPEIHGSALSANAGLRAAVAAFARSGRPVVAECGGLLYLAGALDGRPMCGVVEAQATMGRRLVLGYRQATAVTGSVLWSAGETVRGHEFHYSRLAPAAGRKAAWRWDAGNPPRRRRQPHAAAEGFVTRGVHASYLHTHWAATPHVAARLVTAAAVGRGRA